MLELIKKNKIQIQLLINQYLLDFRASWLAGGCAAKRRSYGLISLFRIMKKRALS